MTYIGLVVDQAVYESNESFQVDIGYGVKLPESCFIVESVPSNWDLNGFLAYLLDRMSWPGMKVADTLICKVL